MIVGLSGPVLTPAERASLREIEPLGIIIFKRNITTADALEALVKEACQAARARLAFVDQEGGRVQRLRPPLAPLYPPAATAGKLHARDPERGLRLAHLQGLLIAHDLLPYGLNAPCLPVADVPVTGAHDVIGDRAYARDPQVVAALAGAAAAGVRAGGGVPVVKHIPGHGRATADTHLSLPDVGADLQTLAADFLPFKALAALPMGMTAHVRYTRIDAARPATLSPPIIDLIRTTIGFGGLLMTDDISMGALSGKVDENAKAALAAGCDCVLHCNGKLREMENIAAALPEMTPDAARRLEAVHDSLPAAPLLDIAALRAEFDALVAGAR
ncbi:MAG: glycoside hydrolase family 3 N-terminal domain-containing protein [Pseudomonadota bacterium]